MKKKLLVLFSLVLLGTQVGAFNNIEASLELSDKTYDPGEELKGILNLKNQDYKGKNANVLLIYSIKKDGETIREKSATITLGEERKKTVRMDIPDDTPSGKNYFEIDVKFGENEEKLRKPFKVDGRTENSLLVYAVVLCPVLAIMSYFLYRKLFE